MKQVEWSDLKLGLRVRGVFGSEDQFKYEGWIWHIEDHDKPEYRFACVRNKHGLIGNIKLKHFNEKMGAFERCGFLYFAPASSQIFTRIKTALLQIPQRLKNIMEGTMPTSTTSGAKTLELSKNQVKYLKQILSDRIENASEAESASDHFALGHAKKLLEELEG